MTAANPADVKTSSPAASPSTSGKKITVRGRVPASAAVAQNAVNPSRILARCSERRCGKPLLSVEKAGDSAEVMPSDLQIHSAFGRIHGFDGECFMLRGKCPACGTKFEYRVRLDYLAKLQKKEEVRQ